MEQLLYGSALALSQLRHSRFLSSEVNRLNNDYAALVVAEEQLKADLRASEGEADMLRRQLEEKTNEITLLKADLRMSEEEIDMLRKQVEEKTDETTRLKENAKLLTDLNLENEAKLTRASSKLQEIAKSLRDRESSIQDLKKKLSELKEKLSGLEPLRESLKSKDAQIQELQQRLSEAEKNQSASQDKQIQELTERLKAAQNRMHDLGAKSFKAAELAIRRCVYMIDPKLDWRVVHDLFVRGEGRTPHPEADAWMAGSSGSASAQHPPSG